MISFSSSSSTTNKKTQQAFAGTDKDDAEVARIEQWFENLWRQLRRVFEDESLKVEFDRQRYKFDVTRRGYTFDLSTLADGHAAVLSLLAEIIVRVDVAERTASDRTASDGTALDRTAPPTGVVIIDEIETHLHLSLQEKILPLLTAFFPSIQFIVATHSPAVLSSVPNALIYDLAKKSTTMSDELRGVRYGAMMTGHFGLPDDVDLDTVDRLKVLRELARVEHRSEEQQRAYEQLCSELTNRSAAMGLEVYLATAGDRGAS